MERENEEEELENLLFVQVKEELNSESDGDTEEEKFKFNYVTQVSESCEEKLELLGQDLVSKTGKLSSVLFKADLHEDPLSDEAFVGSCTPKATGNQEECFKVKDSEVEAAKNIKPSLSSDHKREHFISKRAAKRRGKQVLLKVSSGYDCTADVTCAGPSTFALSNSFKETKEQTIHKQKSEVRRMVIRTIDDTSKCKRKVKEICNIQGEETHVRKNKKGLSDHCKPTANKQIHSVQKPYKCHHCEKAFCQKVGLTIHMRNHSGERMYKCNQCEKAYFRKDILNGHMQTHAEEKPYKCHQCDKAYSWPSSLSVHMRIHKCRNLYKCTNCDKAFIESTQLTEHMRLHTGEKPYKCSHCDRAFSQISHLTSHTRIHTNPKPYRCGQCSMAFSNSSHLSWHMKIHIT